jgi:hypothetical protein
MHGDGNADRPSAAPWIALLLVCLGLFGIAVSVTGLWTDLPPPAVGGTCGPGQGTSETAIEALVDPASIGAGPEPAAVNAAARANWSQFVHECQSATNDRALATLPVLIVSVGITVVGVLLLKRRTGRRADPAPNPNTDTGWPPLPEALLGGSQPFVTSPPAIAVGEGAPEEVGVTTPPSPYDPGTGTSPSGR